MMSIHTRSSARRWLVGLALGAAGWSAQATAQATTTVAAPPSDYLGQQDREIKALSAQETQSLLAGKGVGLARAAELNGYAGPKHVLDLARPLGLSAEQIERTQALFLAMEGRAKPAGRALVEAERELDRMFANKTVTRDALQEQLLKIGGLQANVRAAHLQTHVLQRELLSAEQNALYIRLRGYVVGGEAVPAHAAPAYSTDPAGSNSHTHR